MSQVSARPQQITRLLRRRRLWKKRSFAPSVFRPLAFWKRNEAVRIRGRPRFRAVCDVLVLGCLEREPLGAGDCISRAPLAKFFCSRL